MESPETQDILRRRGAAISQNLEECLPLTSKLLEGDLLYLLTPAAVPVELPAPGSQAQDPFEPLGKALAKYHPWVRHIPYVVRDGITQYHVNHLSLAKAVIFVITGPPHAGQPSQISLSQTVRGLTQGVPHIVIVCCSLSLLGPCDGFFPTLIEIQDYSVGRLESAADVIFSDPASRRARPVRPMDSSRTRWLVEAWDPNKDLLAIQDLWCKCMPATFHLDRYRLGPLLFREGYMKHFVVRDPFTRELLGFCATYTTFINTGDPCVGCIAAILVQPAHRGRGIGSALYFQSERKVLEHEHVKRLRLGSTLPRLLLGPLAGSESEDWFRRLGWRIDSSGLPGTGQIANDWVLDLSDWRASGLSDGGLTFLRSSERAGDDFGELLAFVVRESTRNDYVSFYEQYVYHTGTDAKDILLVVEGSRIVASAISYVCGQGSKMADDMPWPSTISDSAGGLSCICITDQLSSNHTRDSVIIRLINYSVHILGSQGVRMMFLDGIRGGEEGFQSVGFQKWASYKEVWREVLPHMYT